MSPRVRSRGAASKDYDIAHVWAACMAFAACASSSLPGDPVGHARHDALLIDSGLPAFAGRYLRTCERRHCICSKFAARHEVTDIEGTIGATHTRDVCMPTHPACSCCIAACIKHGMHRPSVWHKTMPSGHPAACSAILTTGRS